MWKVKIWAMANEEVWEKKRMWSFRPENYTIGASLGYFYCKAGTLHPLSFCELVHTVKRFIFRDHSKYLTWIGIQDIWLLGDKSIWSAFPALWCKFAFQVLYSKTTQNMAWIGPVPSGLTKSVNFGCLCIWSVLLGSRDLNLFNWGLKWPLIPKNG